MKLKKNIMIRIVYLVLLYVLYTFLLKKFNYTIKYLTTFLFLIFIFIQFIFGQLDFYVERFRLKGIFINFIIDFIFFGTFFVFLKRFNIIWVFSAVFLFQICFRAIASFKYMKKKNVLIFGSNHIKNNVQGDLISNLDYNYVGYVSNNRSRATRYLKGNYEELEKVVKENEIDMIVIVKDMRSNSFKKYLKRLFSLKTSGIKILSYDEFNESIQKKIDASKINEQWLLESNGFDILNNQSQKNAKRALDLVIAIGLLVLALPTLTPLT